MAKPDLSKRLQEDRNAMYDGMCHVGMDNQMRYANEIADEIVKEVSNA